MDEQARKECAYIRKLTSSDAAAWLLNKYPPPYVGKGKIIPISISHRSWKKREQMLLAHAYLRGIPFASSVGYEMFLSFMSIPNFIKVIREYLPSDPKRLDLLLYCLGPALRKYQKTEKDENLINEFIVELKGLIGDNPYADLS